jgi:hypothetical protein
MHSIPLLRRDKVVTCTISDFGIIYATRVTSLRTKGRCACFWPKRSIFFPRKLATNDLFRIPSTNFFVEDSEQPPCSKESFLGTSWYDLKLSGASDVETGREF